VSGKPVGIVYFKKLLADEAFNLGDAQSLREIVQRLIAPEGTLLLFERSYLALDRPPELHPTSQPCDALERGHAL
jgi:hypothetical protein